MTASGKAVTAAPIGVLRDRVLEGTRTAGDASNTRRVFRLVEEIGAATTADLTPEFLERFRAALATKDVSAVSRQTYTYKLAHACKLAVEWGLLSASPFEGRTVRSLIAKPYSWEPRRRIGSAAQFKAVMDHLEERAADGIIPHRLFALAAVMAYTGLPHRDAIGLRVADVDTRAKTIALRPRAGRRGAPGPVPVPDELARVLAGWLAVLPGGSEWLFPALRHVRGGLTPSGRSWAKLDPRIGDPQRLKAAGEAAGVRWLRLTDLRVISKTQAVPGEPRRTEEETIR